MLCFGFPDLQLSMIRSVINNGAGFETEYTREGELTTVTFSKSTIRGSTSPGSARYIHSPSIRQIF